ncbi:MAG: hypothetical protein KDA93_26625, partial [Planctomycetaceae bacterium]|nr:hypothetical protein [Planctomycetaceae bacterium]
VRKTRSTSDHFCRDEGGLDYAVFTLNDNECKLLQQNGIKTFPFRDNPLSVTSFDRHFIVGFPHEHTDSERSTTQAGVGLKPVCVPVCPIADCPQANGRLAFEIVDKGELQSVVGLSGGPVFGINHDGDQLMVYLVAIQSAWDKASTAFACSIEDVFIDWKQHLESQNTNR